MRASLLILLAVVVFHQGVLHSARADGTDEVKNDGNRVVSVAVSQDFLNEQVKAHLKPGILQALSIELDPSNDQIYFHGIAQVPLDELRAINLDPKMGRFRFQLTAKLSVSHHGHLIIEFPLNQTYFFPADSDNPKQDRVVIPVQMLSIALASARGYLAAISGDFGGFDRHTAKLEALLATVDREIARQKNPDALDELKTQRESLKIQLAAIPVERKQLQDVGKEYSSIFGFTGEKELNLNDELAAKKNALVLKIQLSQIVPYLEGVDLGGIRLVQDKKDGAGENYFVIDVNSQLADSAPPPAPHTPSDRPPMKTAPALLMRLNQSLFESRALVNMEQKEIGSKVQDFRISLKDDGLHVQGKTHVLLGIIPIPFETIVDFVTTDIDTFEIRVREMKVAGLDFDFLATVILESLKKRLNQSLKGICHFHYVGDEAHAHALRVTVDPKALVPAFPDLHLVNVDVREGEFLMKVGRP